MKRYRQRQPDAVQAAQVPEPDQLVEWGQLVAWLQYLGVDFRVAGPAGHVTGVDFDNPDGATVHAAVGTWLVLKGDGYLWPWPASHFAAFYEEDR